MGVLSEKEYLDQYHDGAMSFNLGKDLGLTFTVMLHLMGNGERFSVEHLDDTIYVDIYDMDSIDLAWDFIASEEESVTFRTEEKAKRAFSSLEGVGFDVVLDGRTIRRA